MVWFTMAHGIVNEVYYPRVDQANVRDMQMIVTADPDFFAEEKRDTRHTVEMIETGVPAFRVTNSCNRDRFRIRKTLLTDPDRDVLLQSTTFDALSGSNRDYRLFVLLAPHLDNQGYGNTGWVGDYNGWPMLFARRGDSVLALACSATFASMSCGFVGVNDGWQQLSRDRRLTACYDDACNGNVALTGEIELPDASEAFVLALAFGRTPDEAAHAARASLLTEFDATCKAFIDGWRSYHARSRRLSATDDTTVECKLSVAVLQTHEDKVRRGAFIASLSIPWGNERGDHDLGGYHVVWARDLVEIAGGLLAAGYLSPAHHALHYLMTTQNADGHWPQNMWLDGRAYWSGNQLDETGFPILLADQLRRHRALGDLDPWPMVRSAAAYLARTGPVTPEDRWEEDGGYSTFTLAVEIAALLVAADFADRHRDATAANYLRQTADMWNASLERWTYVRGTPLATGAGVDGYYVRIAPGDLGDGDSTIAVKNQPPSRSEIVYSEMVSPDALALVRFGLRAPDDEKILNTIGVIDWLLCTTTPNGPVWHRYNDDGYGEHEDGSAFDGTGIGRGWPLLAGERGHYEVAAGRPNNAQLLLDAVRRQSGRGGLIPEQVWDAADIPERSLFCGCPSGSAMPLAWAHAEFLKLARSLRDERVFDTPPQTVRRYAGARRECRTSQWRFNNKVRAIPAGNTLRIEALAPFVAHWSCDEWRTVEDTDSVDSTLGIWFVDLPTADASAGGRVLFTFFWPQAGRWEGEDFAVHLDAARHPARASRSEGG